MAGVEEKQNKIKKITKAFGSDGQKHVSMSSFYIAFSIIFLGLGLSEWNSRGRTEMNIYLGLVYIGIFVGTFLFFSIKEIQRQVRNYKIKNATKEIERKEENKVVPSGGIPKTFWIWLFLASEVVFFTMVIGLSFALRLTVDESFGFTGFSSGWLGHDDHITPSFAGWVDHEGFGPNERLNLPLTTVNTFLLIISSFTMALAVQASKKGDNVKTRNLLLATVGIGAVFLGIQIYEYIELFAHGFDPSAGLFGATFYFQTGFHGLHVLAGLLLLGLIAYKAHLRGYSKEDNSDVEIVGLYWHFVDLVWIILFTVVYLV